MLRNGQYDAVVGNPPYITVKDNALNALYRDRYCKVHAVRADAFRFMERFFCLRSPGSIRDGWARSRATRS